MVYKMIFKPKAKKWVEFDKETAHFFQLQSNIPKRCIGCYVYFRTGSTTMLKDQRGIKQFKLRSIRNKIGRYHLPVIQLLCANCWRYGIGRNQKGNDIYHRTVYLNV